MEDVEDDPAQGAEVLRRVADVGLVVVFPESRVQNPMAAVLDAPVAADGLLEILRILFPAADVVSPFPLPLRAGGCAPAVGFHNGETGQRGPFGFHFRIEHSEVGRGQDRACGDASVRLFHIAVGAPSACRGEVELAQREVEMILHLLMEIALVAFQREDVVAPFGNDLVGDVGVGDATLHNPCAHRVDGVGFQSVAAPQALAVKGDDAVRQKRHESAEVFGEAGFEKVGVDDREDVRKSLRAWDSVGDFDPLPEPILLDFAEVFDVGEPVHAAEHRRGGHEKNPAEMMSFVTSRAGILDDLKGMEMDW